MRLWHKDLISLLPNQQLLGQWRECCCIARNIAMNGTPNHLLVNKVLEYPSTHFQTYCQLVVNELKKRGYEVSDDAYNNCVDNIVAGFFNGAYGHKYDGELNIFKDWHNDRYLMQCVCNLSEKYDCGGIPDDEWQKVLDFYLGDVRR